MSIKSILIAPFPFVAAVSGVVGGKVSESLFGAVFDENALKILIPGIIFGLAGGFAAALYPPNKKRGFWVGAATVLIGLLSGAVSALFIAGIPWISEYQRWGINAIAGFLAQQILDKLARSGPGFLDKFVHKVEHSETDNNPNPLPKE